MDTGTLPIVMRCFLKKCSFSFSPLPLGGGGCAPRSPPPAAAIAFANTPAQHRESSAAQGSPLGTCLGLGRKPQNAGILHPPPCGTCALGMG